MRFARVAVPLPLLDTFTYRVPAHLQGAMAPGQRVEVPFGSQALVAYVLAEADEPAAEQLTRTREVLALLDEERPSFTPALLELCAWASEYYVTGIGELLRAALPAQLSRKGTAEYRVTDAGVMKLAALPEGAERQALELLLRLGRAAPSAIAAAIGAPAMALLRDLEGRGLVRPEGAPRETKQRMVKGVIASDVPWDEARALVARSPAQLAALEYLRGEARPLLVEELARACDCSPSVVTALARKGLVSIFEQEPPRDLDMLGRGRGSSAPIELTAAQREAARQVEEEIAAGRFQTFLLHGVTGSGKTEVYLAGLAAAVARGRGGIFLVPEIALTPGFAGALERRFRGRVAVLHSSMGASERRREWERIRDGERDVVVGARSALFAPLPRLGLVVVDEEHDGSYKQEESPRYHARDLAVVRARLEGAVALLGTATPSLESYWNAEQGRYRLLSLPERVSDAALPRVEIVDVRREPPGEREARGGSGVIFSAPLRAGLGEVLAAGEQAILLVNRRGYSEFLLCRECDNDFRCANCSVTLTYHKRGAMLLCHYCGHRQGTPRRCPRCNAEIIHPIGFGTERVAERCRELFPAARVAVLDRDQTRRRGDAARLLRSFEAGELDVLIGTQMVAKGHHFPRVTLTGVVSADAMLGFPDFRAAEKTFQLLMQVAGRSGRGEAAGRVVLQTLYPGHYAVGHAIAHDFAGFYATELAFRRAFRYPPLGGMALILLRGAKEEEVRDGAEALSRRLEEHPLAEGVRIFGPAPAPLARLQGKYRWHILLRGSDRRLMQRLLRETAAGFDAPGVHAAIDVDPVSTL